MRRDKLEVVEREIRELEIKLVTIEMNLRKQKEIRWELLGIEETRNHVDERN